MKIAFIVGYFPILSETFVTAQVEGLLARGFEVTVVSDYGTATDTVETDNEALRKVFFTQQKRWPLPKPLLRVIDHLPPKLRSLATMACDGLFDRQLNRYDALVAHFGWSGRRLARSRRFGGFKAPFVTFFHGYDIGIPLKNGTMESYRTLFDSGQMLLPVSDYFRQGMLDHGAQADTVRVHRMGIDCKKFRFEPKESPGSPFRFITVCRLVEKKGIEYALKALALLRQQRPELEWHYDLCGTGPRLDALRQMAEDLNLRGCVTFHGPLPHETVRRKILEADCFLQPSVSAENGDVEGCPVVLMEAMALGRIVVSSVHTGIPELIEHGKSGLLSEEKNVEELMRHLQWVIDHPGKVRTMTMEARRAVEEGFDNARWNDRLAECLRGIASGDHAIAAS